ncbi:N-acyl-D-amino-acid deacylase family protein [Luteimonas yindakuii]|uniref:N-acyl-D-amino-acid deacylase family protein n=1 Tax=Luteimonas yindakuii TaxID=2565782 RepID=UPI001421192F|nr:amidohydrolase family protein [Luteimonas yindakuii]
MAGSGWSRREVLAAFGAAGACALLPAARAGAPPALLLRDVRLVDGTGAPARAADVLVQDGRIAVIGRAGARAPRGARVVEGGGRVLAPGFIDLHVHGDPLDASYASYLAMGVTTVVLGQDGSSPAGAAAAGGLRGWLEAVEQAGPDINVAALAGHGTLRRQAGIADDTRDPGEADIARMRALLVADLEAGAFGMSTGLEYVPGMYAGAAELSALASVVAARDGVAMSHMRSEDDDRVEASLREHIEASRPARTHVSHLKVVYGHGESRAQRLLAALDTQRRAGVELTADAYPYVASYTGVGILFPDWALPPHDYAQVLATRRDELRAALEQRMTRRGGPDALLFGSGPHAGRTLAQVAAAMQLAFADALLEIGPGGGSAAHFVMDGALQARLLQDPHVAIASDGGPGMRHPRATGTFARWIEQSVAGVVPLEEAVRKATALPASILRLPDRGSVRVGAIADLVLFDPARVRARSDYVDPFAHAEGFDLVVLAGVPVFEQGERTATAGQVLRHPARSG